MRYPRASILQQQSLSSCSACARSWPDSCVIYPDTHMAELACLCPFSLDTTLPAVGRGAAAGARYDQASCCSASDPLRWRTFDLDSWRNPGFGVFWSPRCDPISKASARQLGNPKHQAEQSGSHIIPSNSATFCNTKDGSLDQNTKRGATLGVRSRFN